MICCTNKTTKNNKYNSEVTAGDDKEKNIKCPACGLGDFWGGRLIELIEKQKNILLITIKLCIIYGL